MNRPLVPVVALISSALALSCLTDVSLTKNSMCDGEVNGTETTVDDLYDKDGDGYFDGDNPDCVATYDASALDCNDAEADANPGLTEVPCDSLDNDCDEATLDEDDWDEDGVTSCEDCDDTDPDVNPYAEEITCNGIDDDCRKETADILDLDGDGYDTCSDCDDSQPDINPGVAEITCDGLDNDCNPGTSDAEDLDADGFTTCDDCNDGNADIHPGSEDICEDGIDQDCSGSDSTCSYSDTWALDTTVALSCAFGNVVIDFSTVYITDTYPNINVSAVGGSLPGSLSGTFSNATDFDASFSIPGSCTESYRLVGSFTSDTEFSGLFSASFTGGAMCVDCTNQNWQINGTR